jgi:hypothetical protein
VNIRSLRSLAKLVALIAGLGGSVFAATSTTWETGTYAEFLKGKLQGLSLTSDGALAPGASIRKSTAIEQPVLWTVVPGPDGSLYAATGHRGKVFKIDAQGAITVVFSAEQPEVFALCFDSQGILYAATSPKGGVYRIEKGKATEIFHPDAKYIWALLPTPQGGLFVATGDQGRIYRIDTAAKAETSSKPAPYFETGQQNVTSLALGPNGHLYAGSEPNGLLFDIAAKDQGTILYKSSLPEIHGLAIGSDGTVYASALGGGLNTRVGAQAAAAAAANTAVMASTPTVISVTDASDSAAGGAPAQIGGLKSADPSKGAATSTITPLPATQGAQVMDVSGIEKSAIYRIGPDKTVETLRSSKDDNVYDLLLDGVNILFSTDGQGRIYSLTPDRKTTLFAELGDAEAVRLVKRGTDLLAAQSTPAKLVDLRMAGADSAQYESPVHDTTTVARWGRLAWLGNGSGVVFRTRSGNSARPDGTWSPWSGPIQDAPSSRISSPNARYIQWRAEWEPGAQAELRNVSVSFLPQNTPPVIRSISVTAVSAANALKASNTQAASSSAFSVTVTDTGEAPAASTSSSGGQTVSRLNSTQTQITWQADDPDGDKLVYAVYFRGEDEHDWKLIRSQIFENSLLLDADVLADGRYTFRVTASDRPSNDLQYARETDLASSSVLIDNTAPTVTPGVPKRHDDVLEVDIEAEDKASSLRRCEYSLDAGTWQPLEAVDGVTDSPKEQFHLRLEKIKPGEHLVVFRVYDTANNAGLARVVVH